MWGTEKNPVLIVGGQEEGNYIDLNLQSMRVRVKMVARGKEVRVNVEGTGVNGIGVGETGVCRFGQLQEERD